MMRLGLYLLGSAAAFAIATPASAAGSPVTLALASNPPATRAAANADAIVPIRIGDRLDGRFIASDPRIGEGQGRYRFYSLSAPQGARVAIRMRSSDFDSYLEIGKMENGSFSASASNDDAGGQEEGLNSRLITVLRGDGPYLIRARGYAGDALGAYTISVEQLPPAPPPPAPIPLAAGQPRSGTLAEDGPRIGDEGARYAYYTLTGTPGQRIELNMKSDAFDSYLDLGTLNGDEFTALASNDDGGRPDDKLNARLIVTLPDARGYVVRARSLGDDATGAYTLSLRQLPPAPPPAAPVAIQLGREVKGALTDGDAVLPAESDGLAEGSRYYKLYAIAGRPGQTITVNAHSAAFDTVLDAGVMTPIGFGSVAHNDDAPATGSTPAATAGQDDHAESGGSNDSRLTLHFAQPGTILIRVSGYRDGATGAFTLTTE